MFIILVFVAAWFGVPVVWEYLQKKTQPRYVEVKNQDEAMDKLKKLVLAWDMNTEDLKNYAEKADIEFSWMEDGKARNAARHLLAIELGSRGLWKEAYPMVASLVESRFSHMEHLTREDKSSVIDFVKEWGDRFIENGDAEDAGKLYEIVVKTTPETDSYFSVLSGLIDLRYKNGDIDGALSLISMIKTEEIQSILKEPINVRKAASYLLLEDELNAKKGGGNTKEGEEIAFKLLENESLNNVPEMGRILLSRNKEKVSGISQMSSSEKEDLLNVLEKILVCFRSSGEDMVYAPEIMLAIANIYGSLDNIPYCLLWLDRSEGAAMVLGVDAPRVVEGKSLKEEITKLRNYCRQKLQIKEKSLDVKNDMSGILILLEAGEWTKARENIAKVKDKVAQTPYNDGYQSLLKEYEARVFEGEENWAKAMALYETLLEEWDNLPKEQRDVFAEKIIQSGDKEFPKSLYRRLANTYVKQDMLTKAKATLKEIGEELPKPQNQNPAPAKRSGNTRRGK